MISYYFEYIQYTTKTLDKGVVKKNILKKSVINIKNGCLTALTGKSGCGKTSVMYRLGLIENTTGDRYIFNDDEINLWDDEIVSKYRGNKISFVYQDNNLFNDLTLQENFDILNQILSSHPNYCNYMHLVGLDPALLTHKVYSLSGGEKQRATIALALMKQPELLLLDEPTSALDNLNKENIINILKEAVKKHNMAVLIISHDRNLTCLCDEIYEINDCTIQMIKSSKKNDQFVKHSLTNTSIPFSYLKSMLRSKLKIYYCTLIALVAVLSSIAITLYRGASFMKERAKVIGSLPDTTIYLVNNNKESDSIQDYIGNSVVNKDIFQELYTNNNIKRVIPVYPRIFLIMNPKMDLFRLQSIALIDGILDKDASREDLLSLMIFDENKGEIRRILENTHYTIRDIFDILNGYDSQAIEQFTYLLDDFDNELNYKMMEESKISIINQYATYAKENKLCKLEIYDLLWSHCQDRQNLFFEEIDKLGISSTEFVVLLKSTYMDTPFVHYVEENYLPNEQLFYKAGMIDVNKNFMYSHKIYLDEESNMISNGIDLNSLDNMNKLVKADTQTYYGCLMYDNLSLNDFYTSTKQYLEEIYGKESKQYLNNIFINDVIDLSISFYQCDNFDIQSTLNIKKNEHLFSDIDFPIYYYDYSIEEHPMASSSYLIEVDSIENIQYVVKKLKSIDSNLKLKYDTSKLSIFQKLIININTFIYIFIVILCLMVFIILMLITRIFIKYKQHDIGLFKIYGLSEKKTFRLFNKILIFYLIIVELSSSIVVLITAFVLKKSGFVPVVSVGLIILLMILFMILNYIPMRFYLTYILKKIKMNELLKSE